jgi:hypothetical protein
MLAALERLTDHSLGGGAECQNLRATLWEPDQFNGSDPKKLRGFLLQCTLNFHAKPQAFRDGSAKVNYVLFFLKETALNNLQLYLVDDPANAPIWASDYSAFTEELYLNFSPYNQVLDAEVELENMVMKDNHKVTRFFVNFYRLASMLQYNDSALHRQADLALPKQIKDEMVHFDKTRSPNDLRDLVQDIDLRYWERHGELSREPHSAPKTEAKHDKSSNQTEVPRTTTDIKVKVLVIPMLMPITIKAKERKSQKGIMLPTGTRNPSQTESVRMANLPPRNANGAWITSSA